MKTVIDLGLDNQSIKLLEEYVKRFGKTLIPRTEFHSTVYFSREDHICRDDASILYIKERLPIELNRDSYSLDVFGNNNLVLKYENDYVTEIEMFLRKRKNGNPNFSNEYSSFSPHITLGKNFNKDNLKFSLFLLNEKILFDSFSWTFKEE